MRTIDFDFELPPDRVATVPPDAREDARLLLLDRRTGARKHARFKQLLAFLPPRALIVLNDTRVLPARLRGRKPTGGAIELLLTRCISRRPSEAGRFSERWRALCRGGSSLGAGAAIDVGGGVEAVLLEQVGAGEVVVELTGPGSSGVDALDRVGEVPLPPYIEAARRRAGASPRAVDDRARYQTVYAAHPGAVAAPTAGLHFTREMLAAARTAGHDVAFVTLHVGPGTFRPVDADDPRDHRLDPERYRISAESAAVIEAARAAGRRIVAVGTTVVRTLEAVARQAGGAIVAGEGDAELYLLPGAAFSLVTDLITNFHLPRSTLLMLVAAFAGTDHVLAAYRDAIAAGYRFYSYGDAMLITDGAR